MAREYDFGGYATKNNLRCSDGRVIKHGAFAENDRAVVPLVWQHQHNSPDNIIGHAELENRSDGVYAYCTLYNTKGAENVKNLIEHSAIRALSIHANHVVQTGNDVIHGNIVEVSTVLAGANPGAYIDDVCISHGDGVFETLTDEFVLFNDSPIEISGEIEHAESDKTLQEVFDSMSEEQKEFVYNLTAQLMSQSDEEEGENGVKKNLFQTKPNGTETKEGTMSQAAESGTTFEMTEEIFHGILEDAKQCGSLKVAFQHAATTYGIENLEILFPDAKAVNTNPEFIKRDTEWVSGILNGVTKLPYAKFKSILADITADEARANGYVKGNRKTEEFFPVMKRETGPTTVYKKQKMDRDDILDIKDFNIVMFLWSEMRLMLNEEIARAILIGDGREIGSPDKIDETKIRPIWTDDEIYTIKYLIPEDATGDTELDEIVKAMDDYEGNGTPTLYTTKRRVTKWLLLKDKVGRRLFRSKAELADYIGVSSIVDVPVMKGATRTDDTNGEVSLLGLIVNISDYKVGTNAGGQITKFDDFDIDYNQYKYLLEGRMSGALWKPKTAIALEKKGVDVAV